EGAADGTRWNDRRGGVTRVDGFVHLIFDGSVDIVVAVRQVRQVPGHRLTPRILRGCEIAHLEPVVPAVVGVGVEGDRRLTGESRTDRPADVDVQGRAGVGHTKRGKRDADRGIGNGVGELPGNLV